MACTHEFHIFVSYHYYTVYNHESCTCKFSISCSSVEISPALAEIQKQTVGEVRSHQSKFKVERRDATDRNGWGHMEQQPCWVIMLEVLDNLPYDLIYS